MSTEREYQFFRIGLAYGALTAYGLGKKKITRLPAREIEMVAKAITWHAENNDKKKKPKSKGRK